jgi:Predicted membrane protein (DUF2306)
MSARVRSWPVPVALAALSAIQAPGLAPSCRPRAGRGRSAGGDPGSAMAACLVLGFTAVRRRDIAAHRAWMMRAYAIGLAAGTQAFTEGIGGAIFGTGVLAADLAKGAGWVINLAVAEWALRRPARRRPALPTGPQRAAAFS